MPREAALRPLGPMIIVRLFAFADALRRQSLHAAGPAYHDAIRRDDITWHSLEARAGLFSGSSCAMPHITYRGDNHWSFRLGADNIAFLRHDDQSTAEITQNTY